MHKKTIFVTMRRSDSEILSVPNSEFFFEVRRLLDQGKNVSINPKGNSMIPFIRSERDVVVLSSVPQTIEVGDILLFMVGGEYILHRLVGIDGDKLTFMGDGNLCRKEYCTRKDLVAKVTCIIRNGKNPHVPDKGRIWRFLTPVRRYLIGIYRRVKPSDFMSFSNSGTITNKK